MRYRIKKAVARAGTQADGREPKKQVFQGYCVYGPISDSTTRSAEAQYYVKVRFYAYGLFFDLIGSDPQTSEELVAVERADRAFFHLMRHTVFIGRTGVDISNLSADSGMPQEYLAQLFPVFKDGDAD